MTETVELSEELSTEERALYAVDGVQPRYVARPENDKDVAGVIRLAADRKLGVIPRGKGSKSGLGAKPRKYDVVLLLGGLNRLIDFVPEDLTVTVQAGMKLSDLQNILGQKNEVLPLDPPSSSLATLGGIVATNSSGPRRLRYGNVRDMLLGVWAVNGDGKLRKAGGKVVKNVAGYELRKLYVGSLGTLGVFTQMTFKVYPKPPASGTLTAAFGSVADACRFSQLLQAHGTNPFAIEVLNDQASSLVLSKFGTAASCAVIAGFEGTETTVEWEISEAEKIAKIPGALSAVAVEQQSETWDRVGDLCRADKDLPVVLKISVPISNVNETIATIERTCRDLGIKCALLSHSRVGVVYAKLAFESDREEDSRKVIKVCLAVREFAISVGGALVVEDAPPELKAEIDVWGPVRSGLQLMKSIKAQFDPNHILNPGRFVGGI